MLRYHNKGKYTITRVIAGKRCSKEKKNEDRDTVLSASNDDRWRSSLIVRRESNEYS